MYTCQCSAHLYNLIIFPGQYPQRNTKSHYRPFQLPIFYIAGSCIFCRHHLLHFRPMSRPCLLVNPPGPSTCDSPFRCDSQRMPIRPSYPLLVATCRFLLKPVWLRPSFAVIVASGKCPSQCILLDHFWVMFCR